ncbi:MAG: PRC-barrel domain-containing protein [Nocardioidaceae bacterium]
MTRLEGADVLDRDGELVGRVQQVYFKRTTHRPSWVTIEAGTGPATLPVSEARFDEEGRLLTPYDRATIESAPDAQAGAGRIADDREAALAEHYGVDVFTGGPETGGPIPGVTTDDTGHR